MPVWAYMHFFHLFIHLFIFEARILNPLCNFVYKSYHHIHYWRYWLRVLSFNRTYNSEMKLFPFRTFIFLFVF